MDAVTSAGHKGVTWAVVVEGEGPHQKAVRGQHSPRQFPPKVLSSCSLT